MFLNCHTAEDVLKSIPRGDLVNRYWPLADMPSRVKDCPLSRGELPPSGR